MNIVKQNWKPDTCECLVEEQYDRDDPNAVISLSKVIKKGACHAGVKDTDLYGVIYSNADGENKRKNMTHGYMLQTASLDLATTKTADDGTSTKVFKPGTDFVYSFTGIDSARVMKVSVKNVTLSAAQITDIQSYCDTTFGLTKALVTATTI